MTYADYWLPDWGAGGQGLKLESDNLLAALQLGAFQRAVSNFVYLVTNRNDIPVLFRGESKYTAMTDGYGIVIGMPNEDTDYDVVVGLALHEGSHCAYTPILEWKELLTTEAFTHGLFSPKILSIMGSGGYVKDAFKLVVDILEDMRIDRIMHQVAPGYRPYYTALYNKYQNSPANDRALAKSAFSKPTIENYLRMLISLTNKNLKPTDLPRFQEIMDIVDFDHMHRLSDMELGPWHHYHRGSTYPTWTQVDPIWTMAMKILEIMVEETNHKFTSPTDVAKQNGEMTQETQRHYEKQKEFIAGAVKKTRVPSPIYNVIGAIEDCQIGITDVGGPGEIIPRRIPVLTIKNVTKKLVELPEFPFSRFYICDPAPVSGVSEGIRMGNMLAEQLQFRADPLVTRHSHQQHGRIDKKLIHLLGTDTSSIFAKIQVDHFTPVLLYVTIDASSSMVGKKWEQAMNLAAALSVLAEKNPLIDVVITLRGTGSLKIPVLAVLHDSRKKKFIESRFIFEHVHPSGGTPESLCFEANLDLILEEEGRSDIFFVNISDGFPEYTLYTEKKNVEYKGDLAIRHTVAMMAKLREAGVKILSYFVSDPQNIDQQGVQNFSRMYRQNAMFIDIESVPDILRTLRKLLSGREDTISTYS